ncbi:MAG: SH3 domain-containing protein [Leptospirales bacterium]|nr:SH3 domain-containing protein [Leptospirales bacterium]
MKKITLTSIISLILFCFILSVMPTHNVAGAEIGKKYVAAKSGLNLRSGIDKSSKIITTIPFGSRVAIEKSDGDEILLDGRYGKWVNVKFGNKTGWVFSGSLCDFEPNAVIKTVTDYYNNKWKNSEYKTKIQKMSVKNILDNYIVLSIAFSDEGPAHSGRYGYDIVWKYDAKQKRFFEIYDTEGYVDLFYLDNDRHPDILVDDSCCGNMLISFYFGAQNEFAKVPGLDLGGSICNDGYSYYTLDSCGNTEVGCHEAFYDEKIADKMSFFKFNCKSRKFEKYAESKIVKAEGTIISIDWENLLIVIKDKKDTSYNFSGRYKSYDKNSYFGKGVESLKKDLQRGKDVSIFYVIINGKKTIVDVNLK